MKNERTNNESETTALDLRGRAEEIAGETTGRMPKSPELMSPEEIQLLLHDLRVHQIELEMQNEELRRAQVKLDALRARYFDLYDLAPVGYVTLSEQGFILEANLTAAAMLGVARGALVKQRFSSFILSEDQDIYYMHRRHLFETGAPQGCELRLLRANAAPFWARLDAASARDVDGESVIPVVISDITGRKQAEVEKVEHDAQNRQFQKAESLSRMAGAIAHHFNNQLGVVMGNIDLAMGMLPRTAEPNNNLTAAMTAAQKAAEMSSLMLTYLGQKAFKLEPLDLSGICRESLPMLQAAMPKGVALNAVLPSPGPCVRANTSQIRQILTNLVTNAWEAMGDSQGGIQLTVKTVLPEDIPSVHRFPIGWQPRDNAYACLEVMDPGYRGIADIEKIFDPFFSSKFAGRGLGLAVVLGIVRAHQGVITVEYEQGRQSVFRVFFPVSAEEVSRQQEKAAEAAKTEEGGTVLLVEDEEMIRIMANSMLTRMGFTVLEAKDGVEAVEMFRQQKDEIRCVICDLTMPRMDGWATLSALRKLSPDICFILSSGYDEAQVMGSDHPELPQAFLAKPYRFNSLSDAIRRAMANKDEY